MEKLVLEYNLLFYVNALKFKWVQQIIGSFKVTTIDYIYVAATFFQALRKYEWQSSSISIKKNPFNCRQFITEWAGIAKNKTWLQVAYQSVDTYALYNEQ